MVHRNYRPAAVASPRDPFLADVDEGTLTLEQLLQGYCARVYGKTQNYREVARRLDVDARTVKRYVDAADASVNSG